MKENPENKEKLTTINPEEKEKQKKVTKINSEENENEEKVTTINSENENEEKVTTINPEENKEEKQEKVTTINPEENKEEKQEKETIINPEENENEEKITTINSEEETEEKETTINPEEKVTIVKYSNFSYYKEYINLYIGGGSFKGIIYLGALEYLCKKKLVMRENLKNVYCTSIGSVLSVLYIIGYEPKEILDEILEINIPEEFKINLENIEKNFSLFDNVVFDKIEKILRKKTDDLTIEEFNKKYNVNINIFTTSLNKRKTIILNSENYGNIKIMNAIKASCSIPFLFSPVKINEDVCIDGCVKNMDGIFNIKSDNYKTYVIKGNYEYNEIKNFSSYAFEVLNCLSQNYDSNLLKEDENIKIININFDENIKFKVNFTDLKKTDIIKLFINGITQSRNSNIQ